jgi:hypothetical protein
MRKTFPSSATECVPTLSRARKRTLRRAARSEGDAGKPDLRLAREHVETPLIKQIRREAELQETALLVVLEKSFEGLLLPLWRAATRGDRPAPPVGLGPDARRAAAAGLNFDNVVAQGQAALATLIGETRKTKAQMVNNAAYANLEIEFVKRVILDSHPAAYQLEKWTPPYVVARLYLATAPEVVRPFVEALLRPFPRLMAEQFAAELLPQPGLVGQPEPTGP